jgi:hypothetical protein
MAITAIKEIRNEAASASAIITNRENPFATGNTVEVGGPGSVVQCDMWIPHCPTLDEFAGGHYIQVEVLGPATLSNPTPILVTHRIWQSNHPDPAYRYGCVLEFLLAPLLWLYRLIFERFPYPYGDHVRTTTGTTYLSPGPIIAGNNQVGGDRRLLITDGQVALQTL